MVTWIELQLCGTENEQSKTTSSPCSASKKEVTWFLIAGVAFHGDSKQKIIVVFCVKSQFTIKDRDTIT